MKEATAVLEALAVTARREKHWGRLSEEEKKLYKEASDKQWQKWLENGAAEVILPEEAAKIRKQMAPLGEKTRILQMRHLFTDKNDGKRTASNPLPIDANDRLLVPGYKDPDLLDLRRDAPTASRHSQHLLLLIAASKQHKHWRISSSDVGGAFLKGDKQQRVLYAEPPKPWSGPALAGVPAGALLRLTKGVFGLNDAPRLWWTRLRSFLLANGCRQSRVDPSLFIFEVDGKLEGLLATHVDDLLGGGSEKFTALLAKIDKEFGFGSQEFDSFRHTGKNIKKDMETGEITVSMAEYVENLTAPRIPNTRRAEKDAKLNAKELTSLRTMNGGLQWVQNQLRTDLAYGTSVSQSNVADPKVEHMIFAQSLIAKAKEHKDFKLTFRCHDLNTGGFVAISDAGLGGQQESEAEGPVRSQGGYLVLFADEALARHGERGRFTVLDWRSRRIRRVVRSSFAAETLALADANDALQHLRGCLLDIMEGSADLSKWETQVGRWPGTLVVDARDCHDHLAKETSALPTQKSLLFDLAAIRQSINEGHTKIRWTATENMLADALTKPMDTDHLLHILELGEWSISYDAGLVNDKTRRKAAGQKAAAGGGD